jgi:hypothetical protein
LTIHYHGTPVTPRAALLELVGRHFCVSYADPRDVEWCHEFGQSVMLDNGEFSRWRQGKPTDFPGYYEWTDRWLDYPTTWAVIPDRIDADEAYQEALLAQWPHGRRGVPVWHLHEDISRLLRLCDEWPKVCAGSSAQYAKVGCPAWRGRMDEAFNALSLRHRRIPFIHMLRGMQTVKPGWDYPFGSVDSADIARNHNRPRNTPRGMADRWDAMQTHPRTTCLSTSSTSRPMASSMR